MASARAEAFLTRSDVVLPQRDTGVECEYGLNVPGDVLPKQFVSSDALDAAGIPHHDQFVGTKGGGGRIYPDASRTLEYATAEVNGVAAAADEDSKGADRMAALVNNKTVKHSGLCRMAGSYLLVALEGKDGEDIDFIESQATSGAHDNYLTARRATYHWLMEMIIPSITATRLYALDGMVRGEGFVMAQKIWGCGRYPTDRGHARRTSSTAKPMLLIPRVSLDTDIFSDPEQARVEDRNVDPTLSRVARFAGMAAVSHGMRLVEQQHRFKPGELEGLILKDAVGAGKRYAADLTLTHTEELVTGARVTALDYDEIMLSKAERLNLPQDELEAIEIIQSLIDSLRRSNPAKGEYDRLAQLRIGFAARHAHLLKHYSPDSITAWNPGAVGRSLEWSCITPPGTGYKYWKKVSQIDPLAIRVRQLGEDAGWTERAQKRAAMIDDPDSDKTVLSWAYYRDGQGIIQAF